MAVAAAGCFDAHSAAAPTSTRDGGAIADASPEAASPDGGPRFIEDTLGWRVPLWCNEEGFCAVSEVREGAPTCLRFDYDGEPLEPLTTFDASYRIARVFATCSRRSGSWYSWTEIARPVVCATDSTCALIDGWGPGRLRCVDGLCQQPDQPLHTTDVLALCLADAPRPAFVPSDGSELSGAIALARAACSEDGLSCTLPRECAWPR